MANTIATASSRSSRRWLRDNFSCVARRRRRHLHFSRVYEILDAQNDKPIFVTALVATLFVCYYRDTPVALRQVAADLKLLAAEICALSYEILGWSTSVDTIVVVEVCAFGI